MITREVGEALMELQRALIEAGVPDSRATELVDGFEASAAEELEDSDGDGPDEES